MKKIVLLLGFLLVGVFSFANTVPTNGLLNNVTPTLLEANSSLINNNINLTQPYANKVEIESNYLLVKILTTSCTATVTVTVGLGDSAVCIGISATAPSCAEAYSMVLFKLQML